MGNVLRSSLTALVLLLAVVASAQSGGTFTAPATASPARRAHGRVLDCGAHGAWTEPEGWSVTRTDGGDVLAIEPHGQAILIRVQTRTRTTQIRTAADFERVARQVATAWAPDTRFTPIVEHPRSRWHVDRRLEGTATSGGVALHVVAESRGERQLWVALYPTDAVQLAGQLDAAMTSFLPLTSHACECEYDCDRRPTTP